MLEFGQLSGSSSAVERELPKLDVAGSIPVSRSNLRLTARLTANGQVGHRAADGSADARSANADVAQLAERVLGKDEVTSSILVIGSNIRSRRAEVVRRSRTRWCSEPSDGCRPA